MKIRYAAIFVLALLLLMVSCENKEPEATPEKPTTEEVTKEEPKKEPAAQPVDSKPADTGAETQPTK